MAGTPGSPLFDAHAVEQWLRGQGKLHQASLGQLAWRNIENYQPAAQLEDALIAAGAYLLVNGDQPEDLLTPKQLLARLRTLDSSLAELISPVLPQRWTPQLVTVLDTVAQLSREQEPEIAFEYLHDEYVNSAQSLSGLANTPDIVAGLMLALTGAGTVVFDFTSGTGSILRLAADRAVQDGVPSRCYGQEIKPQYALIALLRLWFVHQRALKSGRPAAPPNLHIGDSMLADAFPDLKADVVVANFPFGIHDWGHDQLAYDPRWVHGLPPRTEPELAWVQHALAHLRIGGTAAVLMPPAAALRPAGRRIRAELVRSGTLRAVIALPPGLMPPAGISLHIWVLTQPDPQLELNDRLLFVDTTATAANSPLTEPILQAWNDYLSGHDSSESNIHRVTPAIQLLDGHVDLTPWRYLPQAHQTPAEPTRTLEKLKRLEDLLQQTRACLPAVQATKSTTTVRAPHASLADLIRSGTVVIQQRAGSRDRTATPPSGNTVLTADDVLTNRPASGSFPNDEAAPRIRAGDILVPIRGNEVIARVATPEQIDAQLGPGLQLVRVDVTQFDPWFVAGALSHTENARVAGRASSAGSIMRRIDVKRLAIPVLPLGQQRAYGQAFQHLAEFQARLREAATTGETLAREINDGLLKGSLTTGADS
ncbi:type II restriction endonuclease subunit M [Actinoplanes lobatus]|uniref:Type II restriction endonuclease subunit M n=1 Tax=Actinoplanes lobatus TaxID=113568 RepID=A0ABQ4AUU5_9ACTN|nr:type II restriction endonuclease subunit M [Actinoplanes lobatus]GIE44817.1 type II restriction endonuclease subunit M [Actinoplanes lobatus]